MFIRFVLLLLFVSFNTIILNAQQIKTHDSWALDGAQERIDSLRKGPSVIKFLLEGENITSTHAHADLELSNHEFNFGVSLTQTGSFYGTKYQKIYRERVAELFNFVTVGFYWAGRDERKNLNRYNRQMREKIDWAVENNLKIKGHPLLWHESLPQWVIDYEDTDKLEKIIYKRIEDLITQYPEIEYWDVYNEAIAPFKDHVKPSGVTRWITSKGGIYPAMETLYAYVNKIDPTKIYTNNHYHPNDPEFLKLNKYFIENNVGYQAIGMQAHMQTIDNIFSEQELWNLLDKFAPLKKNIQFTEVTVTSSTLFDNWKDHQVFLDSRKKAQKQGKKILLPSLKERENYQAAYLKDFYTLLFSHPSVTSITMWNLTDRNAWRGHAGGILDMELQPKKAFYSLKKLIKETWTTKISKNFDMDEGLSFSGYYGKYNGKLLLNGKEYIFEFEHKKGNLQPIEIKLTY
jgi:GH35 family endo-1,4-beta-xylanase